MKIGLVTAIVIISTEEQLLRIMDKSKNTLVIFEDNEDKMLFEKFLKPLLFTGSFLRVCKRGVKAGFM